MVRKRRESSLISFQQKFGTEHSCIEYLAVGSLAEGLPMQEMRMSKSLSTQGSARVFQCSNCRFQESVTAGTILHRTKLPLAKWFWAAYLMAQDRRGVSAAHVARELGLHYATAWNMLHKLRRSPDL